jgi:hypothetical protein
MNQAFAQPVAATFPSNQAIVGRFKNFTPPRSPRIRPATRRSAPRRSRSRGCSTERANTARTTSSTAARFVFDEFNGVNQDNRGTVRSRHLRSFKDGLWGMIIENGRSRVWLGVHWVFDAFAVDEDGNPDLKRNIGGVPLGLNVAEDIYKHKMKKSTVGSSELPKCCCDEPSKGDDKKKKLCSMPVKPVGAKK